MAIRKKQEVVIPYVPKKFYFLMMISLPIDKKVNKILYAERFKMLYPVPYLYLMRDLKCFKK